MSRRLVSRGRWMLATSLVLLASVPAAPAVAAGDGPHVEELETHWHGDTLWVGYRVGDGLSARALERIHSGIPLTFEHRIEVVSRRVLGLLPARVHARATIEARVAYDSLTGQYELTRTIEVRRRGEAPRIDSATRATDAEAEMRRFMLRVPPVGLYARTDDDEGRTLRLRVESELERRWVLLLFPSRVTTSDDLRVP